MSSPCFVHYQRHGAIAQLTLDRPDTHNAIATRQDCADVIAAVHRAQDEPGVSCLLLTGRGRSFCAGGNLKAMKDRNGIGPLDSVAATRRNYKDGVQAVICALWDCELPMVAAINGHAIGLGLDLACLCDIRVAADTATFASSFIKLGIIPGDGGAWILPRIVGLSKASEMILTGQTLDATEALACGIVSRVVAPDALLPTAIALAEAVTANPAKALRLAKRLLREGQQQGLREVLELSAAFQALAHESADHAEAVDAFLQKRPPRFTGD
jgi:2-(1,2-epoxy-1,2-dihydrophenyl)acetyl-CoA isomerase